MAVLRVQLLHHAVNVILHREFREIEVGGDFLVAETHGYQGHQLALPLGQLEAHAGALFGDGSALGCFAGNGLEQDFAEFGGADRFALGNGPYGVNEFGGRGAFEDVAVNAQADGLEEDVRILVHAEKDDANVGDGLADVADEVVGFVIGIEAIQEEEIGIGCGDVLRDGVGVGVLADDGEVAALAKETDQGLAEQAVFGDYVNISWGRQMLLIDRYHAEPSEPSVSRILDRPCSAARE